MDKYDLTVNIMEGEESIEADLTYWSYMVTDMQAELIVDTFRNIIRQLISCATTDRLGQLVTFSKMNQDCVMNWNKQIPVGVSSCIHYDIQQYALANPTATAVLSWDGAFTYHQLERASSLLAHRLSQHGVGLGSFVPIYSGKSRWVVVAVLGVLKAGAAFILLDPSHPIDRLREMIKDDIHSQHILTVQKHALLAEDIAKEVILIEQDEEESKLKRSDMHWFMKDISPTTAAYAVFTSGSTGKPKASIVGHQSYATAARAHGKALRLNERSRVIQFASFAFDASIMEILTTLMVGGCICMPSDNDRLGGLAEFIQNFDVNWALLTPSVARTLDPMDIPTLKQLVLGGEAMNENDIQKWSPHVDLMNAYGPSECSIITNVQPSSEILKIDPANIGHPTGAVAWVVDQNESNRLVPVGAVGELLLEGPIVGKGYINRPALTAAAFVPGPPWRRKIHPPPEGLLYKTGDLVRMLADGSLRYARRKDRQVKLHGQRIELGEVEYHVQHCFPGTPDVCAEVVAYDDEDGLHLVVAVLQVAQDDEAFQSAVSVAQGRLHEVVPPFMIPSLFLRFSEMPRLLSGKIDRSTIRRHAQIVHQQQRTEKTKYRDVLKESKAMELTGVEQQLRVMWSQLLHCPVENIGPDDKFFSLGGDSIAAMRLASSAHAQGIGLSVADIFLHPGLRDLSVALSRKELQRPPEEQDSPSFPRFSILPPAQESDIRKQAMIQCNITADEIEDIYPCTAMQAGLAAMTAERPGAYVARHEYNMPPDIDLIRLRGAWEKVVARHPILRTRLIQIAELGCLQVVVQSRGLQWTESSAKKPGSVTSEVSSLMENGLEGIFGHPLIRFDVDVATEQDGSISSSKLRLTMHHVVYDAWSLPQLLQCAHMAYISEEYLPTSPPPFQRFVEYTCSQTERALDHWRAEFDNLRAEPFPSLPSVSYRPNALSQIEYTIPTGSFKYPSVTCATAIRMSWALTQAQYQSCDDIVCGIVSSGRNAPVRGIEAMTGPTISALPLRVTLDPNEELGQALKNLQTWTANSIPFEHVGLHQIAKIGPDSMRACSFQTLLNVEQSESTVDEPSYVDLFKSTGVTAREGAFATYAVVLNCVLKLEAVTVTVMFDGDVTPKWKMERIISQFGHILQNVYGRPRSRVRDVLGGLNQQDIQQLKLWNADIPTLIRETVPHAILKHSSENPFAPAVCAWDGDFTFHDLERWSDDLSSVLLSHIGGHNSLVPIYMDRSRWTLVSILGIIKAGAAFVLLDTSYPFARLRAICDKIGASTILTSINNVENARALIPDIVLVGDGLKEHLHHTNRGRSASYPSPKDTLYAVFTSGSTGKPKGITIEHGAFVTMSKEYARRTDIVPGARVLHFGSYAFDVSILETLSTLTAGACVCVPSESGRKDELTEALHKLRPSHALLTPSLARALPFDNLASVQTLMLVGEPIRRDEIERWSERVRLMNLYGPAECTILASMKSKINHVNERANIGTPVAGVGWITDPRDPHQLAPIGAVGELILQGPLVGQGYLNDPDQTAAAFINVPAWLTQFESHGDMSKAPLYRTGDLASFEQDGSLSYWGRKDSQAKLRGQRLELGEVEEHTQRFFPGHLKDIAAEVVTTADSRGAPCLVAFVCQFEQGTNKLELLPSDPVPLSVTATTEFPHKVAATRSRLAEALPGYMVPSFFVPLHQMPRAIGGKIDRYKLRHAAASATRQQLGVTESGDASSTQQKDMSETEQILQAIWARALGIPPEHVGAEESFFRMGGDSISALQATSQARAAGIGHAVADLFQWKTIRRVAEKFATSLLSEEPEEHERKSDQSEPVDGRRTQQDGDGISTGNVEAVLPCTPVQRGILLTQMRDPTSYVPHFIWKIRAKCPGAGAVVDADRLARAWQQVVAQHRALRTVFQSEPSEDNSGFQLVLLRHVDAPICILPESEPDAKGLPIALTRLDPTVSRHSGEIPHQFTLCRSSDGHTFCRLDINHAIIDATSVTLLEHDLMRVYDEGTACSKSQDAYREYLHFVSHQAQESSRAYWSSYLMGIQPVTLPAARIKQDDATDNLQRLEIPLTCSGSDIETFCRWTEWTASNLLHFSWAMTIELFTGSDDVCFGTLTSGRHIPLPHIEHTVGQFSNMAVCRVRLTPHLSLDEAASSLQENYGHILSFQTFPLSEIGRTVGLTVEELASTAINVQYALPDSYSGEANCSFFLEPVTGLDPTSVRSAFSALLLYNNFWVYIRDCHLTEKSFTDPT